MKRYTKADRKDAILICAIAASTPDDPNDPGVRPLYCMIAGRLGTVAVRATTLACLAWSHVMIDVDGEWTCETDADAQDLLESGWSPNGGKS